MHSIYISPLITMKSKMCRSVLGQLHFNLSSPRQHAAKKAVREIQKYFFEICNVHTLTSPIQQMKDKHLVNLPIVFDFKNALQLKHNKRLC